MYNLKIGDRVVLNKKVLQELYEEVPSWYTEEIYTITLIFDAGGNYLAYLDRILPKIGDGIIILRCLMPAITIERKQKLEKLNLCLK